jgi:LmbE family N-acetylglucosaminyl deacetylase
MRYIGAIVLCITFNACQGSSRKENPDTHPVVPPSDGAAASDLGGLSDVSVALPLDSQSMDGGTAIDATVLANDANPGLDVAAAVDLVTIPNPGDAAADVPLPNLDTARDRTTVDASVDGISDNCSSSPDGGGGGCALASVLVIAPHPDDDIITSSGVIVRALRRGEQVHVVYLTNGDILGTDVGLVRQVEAVAGEGVLGVGEDSLIFLGYPDGSMAGLRTSFTAPTDALTAPNGVSHTYAAHGLGRTDYHSKAFGAPAAYNWPNVVQDMASILNSLRPDKIFVASQFDVHPDHQSAYFALVQALAQAGVSFPTYKPTVYTTIVHTPLDWPSDAVDAGTSWPNPAAPNQYFSEIPTLGNTTLLWSERNSLDVPLALQPTTLAQNLKYLAIAEHASQSGNDGYIGLFLHKDEFFWAERPATPSNRPPVVNAGLDQAVAGGTKVSLDGSASFDPEGTGLAYRWIQVDGPPVALSGAASVQPTFAAPTGVVVSKTLTFELVVADDLGWSVPDSVSVVISPGLPSSDLALAATVVASSENVTTGQTAAKAIDGVVDGYPGDFTKEWAGVDQGVGAWIELTWSTPQTVNDIVLYDRPNLNDQVLAGTLSFSDGGTMVVGALDNSGGPNEIQFASRQITSVRFTVTQVSATTSNIGLAEFQVYALPVDAQ